MSNSSSDNESTSTFPIYNTNTELSDSTETATNAAFDTSEENAMTNLVDDAGDILASSADEVHESEPEHVDDEREATGLVRASEVGAPVVEPPKEEKPKPTPAWISFVAGVQALMEAEGLKPAVEVQKGFVQYHNTVTGHKLYIAKQARAVTRIDTTLQLVGVLDGAHPLSAPNGKIACQIEATQDNAVEAIRLLMTMDEKVRPAKRAPKATVVPETPSAG